MYQLLTQAAGHCSEIAHLLQLVNSVYFSVSSLSLEFFYSGILTNKQSLHLTAQLIMTAEMGSKRQQKQYIFALTFSADR